MAELSALKSEANPEDDWRAFIGEVYQEEAIPKEKFVIRGVTDRFSTPTGRILLVAAVTT